MNIQLILAKAHGGFAMLLALLALISLAFAFKSLAAGSQTGVNKLANIAGLIETIIAGLVTLTGIVLMFVSPWPLSQLWIWIGLVLMVFYSISLKRLTKPARLAAAEGDSSSKWVVFQAVQLALVLVGYALMILKPF